MKKYITIIIVFIFFNSIEAQIVDVCGVDTLVLEVENYQNGVIEWQESTDAVSWLRIPSAGGTCYQFFPTQEKYYRARVTTSTCDPIYSVISHIQIPPIANAGSDRVVSGDKIFMSGHLKANESGIWSIISGENGSFLADTDPYSKFSGSDSLYTLVWAVSNTCGTAYDTIQVEFKENEYIEQLVVVDTTDVLLSTAAQLEAGEYIIGFSNPVPEITDSTILLGIIGEGFLRKVVSYTLEQDSLFTMQTEQASLEDITSSGAFDIAQVFSMDTTLASKNATSYQRLEKMPTRYELNNNPKLKKGNYYYVVKNDYTYIHPGLSVQDNYTKNGSASIGLSFNETILNTGDITLELNGAYNFTPNIKSDIDFGLFYLKSFNCGMYNGTIERNYELSLTASAASSLLNQEFTLISKQKLIVMVVGGVPIPILSEFNIDGHISVDVAGSMNVTHQYNKTSTYTAAIEYNGGEWDYIYHESDNVQTDESVTVTADLTQNFDIGPNITFKVLGIIGPYVDARITEQFNLCTYNDNWNASVDIGGELTVGAKAEIISGKALFDKSKTWSQGFYHMEFPSNMEVYSGDNQKYDLGSSLNETVAVKVKSNKGFAIPFALVHFEAMNGGSVENATVLTDSEGIAETYWTPNGTEKSELKAYILDCDANNISNSPLVFTAYNNSTTDCSESSLALSILEENDTITPFASMGTMPYEYSMDGLSFSSEIPSIATVSGEEYTITVRDADACYANATYVASLNVCDNTNIQINTNVSGNVIEVEATGGVAPYQYAIDGGSFSITNEFTNVAIGTHTLSVKDANNCINTLSVEVFDNTVPVIANFYAEQSNVAPNTEVQFVNISNSADNYLWDFGDGATSSLETPTHTYTANGDYSVQLIASNAYGSDTLLIENYITVSAANSGCSSFVYGGQEYQTVQIGTQCWMAENLNVGTMINGSGEQTDNGTIEKYCYDNNTSNCDTYGGLYQWDEAMQYVTTTGTQGICPSGWHFPTDDEYKTLEMQLGMSSSEANNTGWRGTDEGSRLADNELFWSNGALDSNANFGTSGFVGLPSGYRYTTGSFFNLASTATFWSSSKNDADMWLRNLFFDNTQVSRYSSSEVYGFSIRCIRDEVNIPPEANNVSFDGILEVGQTLSGSYIYTDNESDPEGASTFVWYRADNAFGTNRVVINGAIFSTYSLQAIDMNKYIAFEVTPVAASGTSQGTAVISEYQGPVSEANACKGLTSFTYEGQIYNTVSIGTQCWMAENLNVGTMINVNSDQTDNSTIEKYCYDNNIDNCETYGGLYQWDEMMQYTATSSSQGICPIGWHLPSDDEYKILEIELGMSFSDANNTGWRGTDEGSKLAGNEPQWVDGELDQDTSFGSSSFNAFPGGYSYMNGSFSALTYNAFFWSSNESETNASLRYLGHHISMVNRDAFNKYNGCSVRCLKN